MVYGELSGHGECMVCHILSCVTLFDVIDFSVNYYCPTEVFGLILCVHNLIVLILLQC